MTAIKYDEEKPRLDLLDVDAMNGLAIVLTYGSRKYASWNWAKGFDWSRLIASTLRHFFAFMRGEDIDPESGLPHIDHIQCNTMFLSAHYHRKLGNDDRFKTVKKKPQTFADKVEALEAAYGVEGRVDSKEELDKWEQIIKAASAEAFGPSSQGVSSRAKAKSKSSKKSNASGISPTSSSSKRRRQPAKVTSSKRSRNGQRKSTK